MDERRLEQTARRLGETAEARVDPERVAARVIARLRSGEGMPHAWPGWPWLTAAAATLLVGLAVSPFLVSDRTPAPVVAAPLLDPLTGDELAEVLDSLDLHAPIADQFPASLDDLNESQLEALLAAMEG
ncbi:MAG TPA: hypothetical protein VGA37_15350 [Gemmatimonadales bacterium]